jgi:hypothetical protein
MPAVDETDDYKSYCFKNRQIIKIPTYENGSPTYQSLLK